MERSQVAEDIIVLALVLFGIFAFYGYQSPACGQTDDLSLDVLADIQFNSSPATNQQLFNASFWSQVVSSFGSTTEQIVPQTVVGFIDSGQQWKNWTIENLQNPPSWINTGANYTLQDTVLGLQSRITSSSNSSGALSEIRNFAALASGYSLAALDFVSFNGLSATQQYFETGNLPLSLCTTFPAQIGQLYRSAFDSNLPSNTRASLLGQALAITALMVVLGGKDGFSAKFGDALDRAGLSDAWPTVKPYLYDIGTTLTASASEAVLSILQAVTSHFPQDSVWATGLTAARIDSMVQVLHGDGIVSDSITTDIQQLSRVAQNPTGEDAVATVADTISYQDGGGIQLSVRSSNKMVLYDDSSGRTETMTPAFLAQVIPGFDPNSPDFIQVHYHEAGITGFHYYEPKSGPGPYQWLPEAPREVAQPGNIVTVSFDLLTPEEFVNDLPGITFGNEAQTVWVADLSTVSDYGLSGNQFSMSVVQEPAIEGVSSFLVRGTTGDLQYAASGIYMQVTVPDLVNSPHLLKITFDGYDAPTIGIGSGSNFPLVTLISSDGVRLRFVSDSGGSVTTTTLYVQNPSVLYSLGDMSPGDNHGIKGVSSAFQIQQVMFDRQLELSMLNDGSNYDLGRLGAEIAYTVGEQKLGINNLLLNEPSQPGVDLITTDGMVIMHARLLNMGNPSQDVMNSVLQQNLIQMTGKLQTDFRVQSNAKVGYAILSYYTVNAGLQTIILEVPAPSG